MSEAEMPKVVFFRRVDRVIVMLSKTEVEKETESDGIKNVTFSIKQFALFQMFLKNALQSTEDFVDSFNNTLIDTKQSFKVSNHLDGFALSVKKTTSEGKHVADFLLTKNQVEKITSVLV